MDEQTPTARQSIPVPLTPLIGRQRELAELVALLRRPETRLVSITGAGGAGKTRLALEAAQLAASDFEGGSAFVSLATIRDPALVLPAIATALGLREAGDRPLLDEIARAVTSETLLLLDNLEQLTAAATEIARLLSAVPELSVLSTSRAPLRIRGEREFPLAPFPVPGSGSGTVPAALEANPAVALFIARARDVRPDLDLSPANLSAIAEICTRVDGLPLAIELAAARSRLLPPVAMLPRLANRLQLLTGGPRDLPARQQTLRDAIAWSDELLTGGERDLFARLSVFAGGFGLQAAEQVVAGAELDVVTGIDELLGHSLLRAVTASGAEPRFAMLETIRDYASERLVASGEEVVTRDRHLAWVRDLTGTARDEIEGRGQVEGLRALELEIGNVRAALQWAIRQNDAAAALEISAGMRRFWEIRGLLTEGRGWLEQALTLPVATAGRAEALLALAPLARRQGDYDRALAAYEEAHALFRERGDASGIGSTLNNLGVIAQDQGDLERAGSLFGQALDQFRLDGDEPRVAAALNNLGMVARRHDDLGRAHDFYQEALEIWRRLGDELRVALALNNLGVVSHGQGKMAEAVARYEEALALYRTRDDRSGIALVLSNLAETVRDTHDLSRAADLWAESLRLRSDQGDRAGIAECLTGVAEIAGEARLGEAAVRLAAASDAIRRAIGVVVPPRERVRQERALAALKLASGAGFDSAWAEGAAWPLAEAVARGQQTATEIRAANIVAPPAKSAAETFGLTKREIDVLRLVVEGMSDKEIGEALYISHRTAMTHVQNLLGKLGVGSRTAAASFALKNELV